MAKESTLKKNCSKLIRDKGGFARSVPGGPHGAGMSDIIGVYRGVALILECKLPGKEHTLTDLQAETLQSAKSAGAVARMITSKSQVAAILDKIDQLKDRKRK